MFTRRSISIYIYIHDMYNRHKPQPKPQAISPKPEKTSARPLKPCASEEAGGSLLACRAEGAVAGARLSVPSPVMGWVGLGRGLIGAWALCARDRAAGRGRLGTVTGGLGTVKGGPGTVTEGLEP